MSEEWCYKLVERLCSSLGWAVKPVPPFQYVLLTEYNEWVAFGMTMADLFNMFAEMKYFNLHVPSWAWAKCTPEELALKMEMAM